MDNMIRTRLNDGTPVTLHFARPCLDTHEQTVAWMKSVRLESTLGSRLSVSPTEIEELMTYIIDEWIYSEEESSMMRNCPCGESHIV